MGDTHFDSVMIAGKPAATQEYVANQIGAANAGAKGAIDASTNPNYPAANAGDRYRISVGGKIGGASGDPVEAGDEIVCYVDSSAAGTKAAVGANWDIEHNVAAGAAGKAASFVRTDAAPVTLLPAFGTKRIVTGTVHVDTVFAAGDGTVPSFQLGETGTPNKFGTINSGSANAVTPFAGELSAGAAFIVTPTAATGTTSTGAVTVNVAAVPSL